MVVHKLWGLRGKAFVSKQNALYLELKEEMRKEFEKIRIETEKFTIKDLGRVAVKFELPVTTTSLFLEEQCLIPSGTWDRVKDSYIDGAIPKQKYSAKAIGVVWGEND